MVYDVYTFGKCLFSFYSIFLAAFDISADLTELGKTPVAVVCAGAKSILDIELTLEYLVSPPSRRRVFLELLFLYTYDMTIDCVSSKLRLENHLLVYSFSILFIMEYLIIINELIIIN